MARVVVLGASLTDMNLRLPRLPVAGETLLGGRFFTGPGGKGANQAVAARRAGAEVTFLTAFGDDPFGRALMEHDRAEGIDIDHARVVAGAAGGVALIFVGEDGQNLIGVAAGANTALGPAEIDALPASVFDPDAVLLISLEVPEDAAVRAAGRAAAAGMDVVLNPAPALPGLLRHEVFARGVVLTPNQEEARALSGMPAETPAEAALAAAALGIRGARPVIVTLGPRGCLVAEHGRAWLVPPCRVEVVDTVGAGDAFNGALAVALAERRPMLEAAAWANAAAALAVTKPGAQGSIPTREAIDALASLSPSRPRSLA